jgi:hypothetical protein
MVINYFNCPDNPVQQVHSYQRVIYKDLYPLIDLVFDCTGESMEYFFVVHPGGDVQKIRMRWRGANSTKLKGNRIVVAVDKGIWQERLPESYTDSSIHFQRNKTSATHNVSVNYRQIQKGLYGFTTASYDKHATLIIDPTPDLIWGTYMGGDLNDWGYALATDANGNIFMAGASSNNALATAGAYKTTIDGYTDAMIGKSLKVCPYGLRIMEIRRRRILWRISRSENTGRFGRALSFDRFQHQGLQDYKKAVLRALAMPSSPNLTMMAHCYGLPITAVCESVIATRVTTD